MRKEILEVEIVIVYWAVMCFFMLCDLPALSG